MRNSIQGISKFLLLPGVLILIPGSLSVTTATLQPGGLQRQPATSGFDSALWQQFCLPDEKDRKTSDQTDSQSVQRTAETDRPRFRKLMYRAGREQLEQTSLAEVVLEDQQADSGDTETGVVLTDWQISKLAAIGQNPLELQTDARSGPTATTLLVGLVATIVVCGALFSGRD